MKVLATLFLSICLSSCAGLFQLRSQHHDFYYLAKKQDGSVFTFEDDYMYVKGDTVVTFPKKEMIIILDVRLNERAIF